MSIQVIYETNHIFLFRNSTMSNALNFCFFMYFIQIQKKKTILEELQRVKKRNTYM